MSGPAEAPRAQARRSAARTSRVASFGIPAYRDDGPISLWLGWSRAASRRFRR